MPLDGDQNNNEECETNISNNIGISRSSHKDFKSSNKENVKIENIIFQNVYV
jgi:hypothetical protein